MFEKLNQFTTIFYRYAQESEVFADVKNFRWSIQPEMETEYIIEVSFDAVIHPGSNAFEKVNANNLELIVNGARVFETFDEFKEFFTENLSWQLDEEEGGLDRDVKSKAIVDALGDELEPVWLESQEVASDIRYEQDNSLVKV